MSIKFDVNKVAIPAAIIIAGILVAGAVFYVNRKSSSNLSSQEVASRVIKYVDDSIASQGATTTAVLATTTDDGVFYKVDFSIESQPYTVYATKDGKYLVPALYDMTATTTTATPSSSPQAQQNQTIQKSAKPSVDFYVMSLCPFGNQAEDTILPVYGLLKNNVNWTVHFIVNVNGSTVTSLHGPNEVAEDEREACVLQSSGVGTWLQFATYVDNNCGSDGSCWQAAAQSVGLSTSTISSCVSSQGLSLMTQEADAAAKAGVNSSPTLFVNGTNSNSVYEYGDPQAYLSTICSAFSSQPQECSQQLATSSANAAPAGSCGN